MRQYKTNTESGISIIEVVVVILIVTILVTFAVASFRSAGTNLDRQNIAREFKISLERARFDSVKRRASVCEDMSGVTINETSFTLSIDMDNDGALSDSEIRHVELDGRSNVTIVPNGVTLPLTIKFDQRGQAFLNDCDPDSIPTATIPLLYFCNGACTTATANSENSNVIFVSPAGTVAMLYGGESMPTFDEPEVATVPYDENINPLLAVWNPNAASPSPSASPDPSGTPSGTPIGTPSGTPIETPPIGTPTITPTATPTPPACPSTPPWGSPPACTCMAPQTERNNGQCK